MADDDARVLREEGLRTRTQTKTFLLRAIQEGKKGRKRLQTFLHAVAARKKFLLILCHYRSAVKLVTKNCNATLQPFLQKTRGKCRMVRHDVDQVFRCTL